MEIPDDFMQLCHSFYQGKFEEHPTEEECIADVLALFSDKRKQVIQQLLDELLSGRHSDAEIKHSWHSTIPSYGFSEGGHRIFLTEIRDMIGRTHHSAR